MVAGNPTFSVIIPTYNRADLLKTAIQSVLNQTETDLEIVVSNGGSTDHTGEVVGAIEDSRIKYVESKTRLPVGDNYQQGLNNASGQYITFLSDDDAYSPTLLVEAGRIVKERNASLVTYNYCRYYHSETWDFEQTVPANSLLIHEHTGLVTRFTQVEAFAEILKAAGLKDGSVDPRFVIPYLSNAIYHRSIFDRLMAKRANLFDFVPPDMYLAAAVFFHSEDVYCLDKPLLLWSNWEGNATATASRERDRFFGHYRKQMEGREFRHVPVGIPSAFNCGADCVIEAFVENGDGEPEISWPTYYFKMWENFAFLRSQGIEVSSEQKAFEASLRSQPRAVRDAVDSRRKSLGFRGKSFLNAKFPMVARSLRRARNSNDGFSMIKGSEFGFSDILGAAGFLSSDGE